MDILTSTDIKPDLNRRSIGYPKLMDATSEAPWTLYGCGVLVWIFLTFGGPSYAGPTLVKSSGEQQIKGIGLTLTQNGRNL